MKRTLIALLTSALLAAPLVTVAAPPASAMPDGTARQGFWLRPSFNSYDIYTPSPTGYRTSPTVFKDQASGQFVQFNCGPDASASLQVIRFTTSADGKAWAPETIVLRPTAGSPDARGVCDPSVVRVGSYYYLAYTGSNGPQTAVFVARTPSLSQPWQKWNGQGWGALRPPAPIVVETSGIALGAAQPSLVVQPGSLAIYYEFHNGTTWQTRLASAPLRADNADTWPNEVTGGSTVLEHPGKDSARVCGGSYDSTDIAYDDAQRKYVALTTDAKSFAGSSLATYESPTGQRFTKALTIATQAGTNPIEEHAHHAAFVRDVTGHLQADGPASIVYGYADSDCPAKLRWHDVTIGSAATGWFSEPLTKTSGVAHWNLATNGWSFDPVDGRLKAGPMTAAGPNRAFLRTNQASANAVIDLDYEQAGWPGGQWTGLSFGQPTSEGGASGGYYLRFYTTGNVTLARGNEDNVVATGTTNASSVYIANHLQVVLSEGTITVYNGLGHDSLNTPVIRYTSPDDLYPSGYIGLSSLGSSWFSNLTVRDNVPPTYRSQDDNVLDWKQSNGVWKVRAPSTIMSYLMSADQIFLQGNATPVSNYNAHFADGTYTATVQLNPGGNATSWGGLNLVNGGTSPYLDWLSGGYLVFIRTNGNVGLFKGDGSGQVVPDVPTGINPTLTPVKFRVLKYGANIQVYLNDNKLPTINYTDSGSPFVTGGFGLATEQAAGLFTNVAYAANNGV